MPNKWFANWGQVVQTACVLAGTAIALDRAYPDLKNNRFFTGGTILAYLMVTIVVVSVFMGIRHKSKSATQSVERPPETGGNWEHAAIARDGIIAGLREQIKTLEAQLEAINTGKQTALKSGQYKSREAEQEKNGPNIVYSGFDLCKVKCSKYGVARDEQGDAYAFVVVFRNQPMGIEKVSNADFVQAEILFRMLNGNEYLTVHHGFWVDEEYNSTAFPLNSKRDLLLVTIEEYPNRICAVGDERESTTRRPPLVYSEVIRGNNEYNIEIILFVDGVRYARTFKYRLTVEPEVNLVEVT